MSRKRKVLLSVVLIIGLFAWTMGTYYIAYHREIINNTPKKAVERFIKTDKNQGLDSAILAPGKAAIGDGYVMVTETPIAYNQFEVFYVQQKDGRWQAQLVTKIHEKNIQGSSRKLTFRKLIEIPSRVPSKQFRIGYAIVLTSGADIAAVTSYKAFTKSGKRIPFSFAEVGSLPIWVYKFSRMTYEGYGIKAYNKAGNVVASMS